MNLMHDEKQNYNIIRNNVREKSVYIIKMKIKRKKSPLEFSKK